MDHLLIIYAVDIFHQYSSRATLTQDVARTLVGDYVTAIETCNAIYYRITMKGMIEARIAI